MKVIFKPENRKVEVQRGTSLLNAARKARIVLETECGGRGRCGKCKVIADKGVTPLTPQERELLTPIEIKNKVRLACQAKVQSQTVVSLLTVSDEKDQILEKGIDRFVSFQPAIKKLYLNLAAEDLKQKAPIGKIIEGFLCSCGINNSIIGFSSLKKLPSSLYKNQTGLTALLKNNEVLGFEKGDTTGSIFGIAVDIGTTTVVGYLFDLSQGRLVGVDSALNEQSEFGSDVVSRIEYALINPGGLDRLQKAIISTINPIVKNLCDLNDISKNSIYSVVVVGNTSMIHLFCGMSPQFLSRSPYNPLTADAMDIPSQDLGIKINPLGRVISLPLVSGFIGSDTVGVVISTGLHKSRVPRIAVDIGTNGEIVCTDGKKLLASSCAAGPAFEGAQIQCGMRGTTGAIDRVCLSEGRIKYHVIDSISPKGLCGSGLVDAVAEMLKAGIIAKDGRLMNQDEMGNSPYAHLITREQYNQFILTVDESKNPGQDVVITQRDIRELQLAKSAMRAGIKILMDKLGLEKKDIREVYLAGGFGNYVRPENAMAIGLLPNFKNAKITQVGNAAGSGAKMALLSTNALKEAVKIAEKIEYVELAKAPDFQREFIKAMDFVT